MIEIRKAEAEDREAVARLIEQLEEAPMDREVFNGVYLENLNNPQIVYLTALSEGKIRGFVSVHVQNLLHHIAPIAEIQELVVDEQARGQGLGKLLFGKAKEIAAQAGCPQLECACNQRRTSSHAFYKKQGMTCRHFKFTLPLRPTDVKAISDPSESSDCSLTRADRERSASSMR